MFLVDDNEPQSLVRQKYSRASTKDDVIGFGGELFLPYLHSFGIGVFGVVDAEAIAKDVLKPLRHLDGEGYLRQEIHDLFATLYCFLYEVNVYLGFA